MTADLGLGANMGIESAVSLANVLHRAVTQNPSNSHFTTAALSALFEAYQTERYPRAKEYVQLSGEVTRMHSYETWWKKVFVSRIATLPFMMQMQSKMFIKSLAKCPKLEYAKTRTINEDAVGWKVLEEKGGGNGLWALYGLVTSAALVVGVSYLAVAKWRVDL
jgi:FAD dependent monooxygenase